MWRWRGQLLARCAAEYALFLFGGVIYLVLWPYGPAQRPRQRCYSVPGQHRRQVTAPPLGLAS